jgi:hypothetical protein
MNFIPEQKKPLEDYQIELAKIKIKQEVFTMSSTPWYKLFPATFWCCSKCKKKEPKIADEFLESSDNKKHYTRVRKLCVEKEVAELQHSVKINLLRRYSTLKVNKFTGAGDNDKLNQSKCDAT